MNDHERARQLAAESIDFALDPDDRAVLDAHLLACASCRSLAERLADDGLAMAMLPQIEPPSALRPSLLTAAARGGRDARRPERLPLFRSRMILTLTAATVVVAVVAGTLVWWTGRPTEGGVANVSPTARPARPTDAAASMEPLPSGAPTAQPGASLPAAALTASVDREGVVPLDAGFTLVSLDETPAAELASRLTVEPPLEMAIEPSQDGRSARLTPSEPLVPGAVYRFTLVSAAGEVVDGWAFQADQPLRVVGTLPDDQQADVPLRTGIEITFDQDGVTDAASHVTIEPAVRGRFEEHGRVLAFVPEGLAPKTVYTVTVRRGLAILNTGQALAEDVVFSFETRARGGAEPVDAQFDFLSSLVEAPTGSRPVISAEAYDEDGEPLDTARVEVYRLPGMAKAIEAYHTIVDAPRWARWSTAGVVATDGLSRVMAADAALHDGPTRWFMLPDVLPVGWYLIQHPMKVRPAQAVLQVTDVAGYVAITSTRSLVWANDLESGGPLAAAAVGLEGGASLGRTDGQGLLVAATPPVLLADGPRADEHASRPVLIVEASDGRTAFLPGLGPRSDFDGYGFDGGDGAPETFWRLLHTDRILYRSTDTINAWGMVRERVSGKVPGRAEIRLVVQRYEGESPRPPLVAMPVTPGRTGAFTGSIPLAGMPDGSYAVELLVDGRVITSTEVSVGPIAKPAYRLGLETGRRVYIEGDRIKTTVRASFFEGSPVPGVRLRVGGDEWRQRTTTTDRTGTAAVRNTARAEDEAGWSQQSAYASVARAEEGEITAYSPTFLVFPSTRVIDADAQVIDGQVRVTGQVHVVDVERVEREIDEGASVWDVDPRGRTVSGATVAARFSRQVPIRRQVGTRYDFIAKEVVPVYEYEVREIDAGRVRVKTDPDGRFVATIPASSESAYRISVSIVDPDGHRARVDAYAMQEGGPAPAPEDEDEAYGPILARTTPSAEDTNEYGVGETIDLTMRWSPADDDDRDRFLFYAARSGLREATVSATPRFTTTFDETAVPNVEVFGVRFTGAAYIVAQSFSATFRTADRALDIDITARAERYRPGGQATLDIRTRTASGRPVSATVVLRAVDEKLFAIGAAEEVEPLAELYASFGSGVIATYASHGLPSTRDGGDTAGGDTGGGDDGSRSEFVDSLLFRAVDTDAQGRATVTFRLSDDLTSWHVSAAAFSTALEAGSGATLIPVGLPFFADVVVAPEYLVADRPAIVVNTYGSDLQVGAKVTVTVESSSLGIRTGSLAARAFEPLTVRLPRLTPGLHSVTITATSGRGASALRDRLTRTFLVVESRLTRSRTSSVTLGSSGDRPDGGQGLTTYLVSDAGRGRYLSTLLDLAADQGARLDQALAADRARTLLQDELRSEAGAAPPASEFARSRYQGGDDGLALLPYASSDVQLSALVALVAPARIDGAALERYLLTVASGAGETRERRIYALAGLAGLQRPVLPEIRAVAGRTDLTVRERLMVGLAAAAIGDAATARSIERSLADAYRESQGSAIRLRVGSTTEDMTSATALMALLAAWNGSPDAPALWDYVEANPAADELHALHAVGFVDQMLDHLPAQPARFAYSIAGVRTVIDLGAGESFELTVDSTQRSTLSFESLGGSTDLTATWQEPARVATFERDPYVRVERTVQPSGRIDAGDLVRVDLTVSFGKRAGAGCRQVTDLVPSGLRPVGTLAFWPYDDEGDGSSGRYQAPYEQTGQRVYFCAEPTKKQRTVHLRYYARVVTPGTYRWEPAVVQMPGESDRAALTPGRTVTIR